MDIREVPPIDLISWLQHKKGDGYAIIGLEQTSTSVSLPDFRFPDKVVLVLGKEKEGIPATLLGLLDAAVEIPQLGIIRSLNVHVSGAILLWELTRQRIVGGQIKG